MNEENDLKKQNSSIEDKRPQLTDSTKELAGHLKNILPKLSINPQWYVSIYYEKKASQDYTANLKQTNMSDREDSGVVFRIYDGYTLYERAVNNLNLDNLENEASDFGAFVASKKTSVASAFRPYKASSWSDRLNLKLDEEIVSQIPENPDSHTLVHFGIRFEKDPYSWGPNEWLGKTNAWVKRFGELAPTVGLSPDELSYIMARFGFSKEESVFLDGGSFLSQTLFRMSITLLAMSGSDRAVYRSGGLGGLEVLETPESEAVRLLKYLKSLKSAKRLNPGRHRVLIGPVLSGVLAHEAFGHSQEGDTCARGRSKAWELHKTSERVGNANATIVNNPAIYRVGTKNFGAWGSYFFDEEGWLAQEHVLLDGGVLKAPMTNLTSALRLGVPRTANGKRESWAAGVYTRQTNTYFSAGEKRLTELLKETRDGFLALVPAGGMEDPKGMGIQVGISYLEEIKDGKLTGQIWRGPAGGDIQMTGYTPDVLHSIVSKSKIEYDSAEPDRAQFPWNDAGGCGKYHKEYVYAGCGGPYMLLDQVILG